MTAKKTKPEPRIIAKEVPGVIVQHCTFIGSQIEGEAAAVIGKVADAIIANANACATLARTIGAEKGIDVAVNIVGAAPMPAGGDHVKKR